MGRITNLSYSLLLQFCVIYILFIKAFILNIREDSECGLLTVGSWYAMTGYGFAMPKNSKYLEKFNKKMIEYRETG